ncbi:MAG: hypothetical protein FJY95_12090 [Candidatus Handelsmanbacteria bacterium]|nr:hypothetical protein [Candidatus Handelsmanbacteria bacterium]
MRHRSSGSAALGRYLLLAALTLFAACGGEDPAFSTPAATFKTYKNAIAAGDLDMLWSCLSANYQNTVYQGDRAALAREWREHPEQLQSALRREIAQEKPINDRIGYLLFDSTTLASPQTSPFFYFIREGKGWKLTTHLDSLFHRELEQAIAKGEFKLPSD